MDRSMDDALLSLDILHSHILFVYFPFFGSSSLVGSMCTPFSF